MIKQIKKGNKASYNGYLLGVHEYEEFEHLKKMMPKMIELLKTLRSE